MSCHVCLVKVATRWSQRQVDGVHKCELSQMLSQSCKQLISRINSFLSCLVYARTEMVADTILHAVENSRTHLNSQACKNGFSIIALTCCIDEMRMSVFALGLSVCVFVKEHANWSIWLLVKLKLKNIVFSFQAKRSLPLFCTCFVCTSYQDL